MAGEILYHRNSWSTSPEYALRAIAPYREDLVVSVECMFAWYWIADLCLREGITFVLGHALYMKAIHGGKTKNDRIDSKKIAFLLRGGNIPFARVCFEALDRREKVGNRGRFRANTRRIAGLFNEDLTGIGPILPLLQQVHEFQKGVTGRPRAPWDEG
jgi:hypothetical protein